MSIKLSSINLIHCYKHNTCGNRHQFACILLRNAQNINLITNCFMAEVVNCRLAGFLKSPKQCLSTGQADGKVSLSGQKFT
jgi:hypothetical protein